MIFILTDYIKLYGELNIVVAGELYIFSSPNSCIFILFILLFIIYIYIFFFNALYACFVYN